MEKIIISKEGKDTIVFLSRNERFDDIDFRIRIENGNDGWKWILSVGTNYWNPVNIRNKKFILKENLDNLSVEMRTEINQSFYEFFRQLKNHRNYRLKLINLLNDEIREIWEIV